MSIKPLHLSGVMQRSQDVSTLKHNDDQKPVVQQENIQVSFQKKTQEMVKTVTNPQQNQEAKGQFDAKEEGKNKYFFQDKKNKNRKTEEQGSVKKKTQSFGFDVTI